MRMFAGRVAGAMVCAGLWAMGGAPLWGQRETGGLPEAPSAALQGQAAGSQVAGQSPTGETETERKARLHAEAEREVKTEEGQRSAKVVPNLNTVISGQGVALSKGQKTELAVHATFDPFNAVGAFVLAGTSELTDTHRGYGWGPGGYFKRVGANGTDVVVGTMLSGAVYPILLRQDPGFFRQGKGTIPSRARRALAAPFVCRGDNGRRQINFSNVLGNFSAGAISYVYYAKRDRGLALSAENSAVVLMEGSLGNIGLNFAPDVSAYFKARRARAAGP